MYLNKSRALRKMNKSFFVLASATPSTSLASDRSISIHLLSAALYMTHLRLFQAGPTYSSLRIFAGLNRETLMDCKANNPRIAARLRVSMAMNAEVGMAMRWANSESQE